MARQSHELKEEEAKYLEYWVPRCRHDKALFSEKLLGIKLNAGQERVSKEIAKEFSPVNLILTGNRFGKTVYEAIDHIYHLFYKITGPGVEIEQRYWADLEYVTCNLAPSSELTKIMLETIMAILRGQFSIKDPNSTKIFKNPCKIRYFIDSPGLNNYDKVPEQGPYSLRFANRSTFRAFTLGQTHGDTIQGRAFAKASYDEFGRSKNPEKEIDDILPRLQQYNGALDIITTPDLENEETVSYLLEKKTLVEEGTLTGWRYIKGSVNENEYISKANMDQRLAGMSAEKRAQIVTGQISLMGATYFDISKVNLTFNETLSTFPKPINGHVYFAGLDSAGSGKDYWAVTVVDTSTKPMQVYRTYYDRYKQPFENIAITKNILDSFIRYAGRDNLYFVMDKTNEAGAIYYQEFEEYNPYGYRFGTEKGTGKSTKALLTDTLRRCINDGMVVSPKNNMLKNQLLTYKGPNDDEKQTTDALMSIALAVYFPYNDYVLDMQDQVVTID